MANVIYGSEIAKQVKKDLRLRIMKLKNEQKRLPKLVVVLVGEHPASVSYVKGKEKACHEIGMENDLILLPATTSEDELLQIIHQLNTDTKVDGILVQLPLPAHMDEHVILHAIDPKKDVDGFHPVNVGKMLLQEPTFLSCTPKGIIRMLEEICMTDLSGKQAVVLGRSNIVGKPVAQLLLNHNATVTICHSKTEDIKSITKRADILVVSVGKARLVKRDWVKPGAVVIDVGINRDDQNKLCGDVDFANVSEVAGYITPVPKGVGPMTIAMLLENTLQSYEQREHVSWDER